VRERFARTASLRTCARIQIGCRSPETGRKSPVLRSRYGAGSVAAAIIDRIISVSTVQSTTQQPSGTRPQSQLP
jgi:hypothetical protein